MCSQLAMGSVAPGANRSQRLGVCRGEAVVRLVLAFAGNLRDYLQVHFDSHPHPTQHRVSLIGRALPPLAGFECGTHLAAQCGTQHEGAYPRPSCRTETKMKDQVPS